MKYLKGITVLILIMSVLTMLSACRDHFMTFDLVKEYVPAAGKGYISLSFYGDTSARSIKPLAPNLADMHFDFAFYSGDEVVNPDEDRYFAYTELQTGKKDFELDIGGYKLVVLAYNLSDTSREKPIAKFEEDITIKHNDRLQQPIDLKAIISDEEDEDAVGSFRWDIGNPAGIQAKMYIQQLDPATGFLPMSGKDPIYLIGSSSASEPLASKNAGIKEDLYLGFYDMFLVMESNGKTITIYEVLYVFKNLESVYETLLITNDTFADNKFLVTFISDGNVVSYCAVTEGDATTLGFPANPTKAGYRFTGWYFDSPTSDNAWLPSYYPTGHFNLYAKFIPNLTGTVHLVITEEGDIQTIEIDYIFGLNTGINSDDLTYQWFANSVLQSGATNNTYVIPTNQAGGNFRVEIRHPNYYGYIYATIGADLRGETADNPLLVTNLATLRMVGTDVFAAGGFWTKDAFYKQTSVITVTGAALIPIGNSTSPFTGGYDGDGHEIINLTQNTPSGDNLGLFGFIGEDAVIQKVILVNSNITGRNNIGSIAAINYGTLDRCVVTNGRVTGVGSTGGIVGENFGTIINSYSTGTVFGTGSNIGGIAGANKASGEIIGSIQFCYSTMTISGDNFVGGISGRNEASIRNCFALNPNITSHYLNAGRISSGPVIVTTGDIIMDNNRARTDNAAASIRVTETQGTRIAHDGAVITPAAGTTMISVFTAAWDAAWDRPANALNLNLALPMLKIWPANPPARPWPTLPEVRIRTGNNTANLNINVHDFITFQPLPHERGWYVRELTGKWVLGEMKESIPSGPVKIPDTFTSGITGIQPHRLAGRATNDPITGNFENNMGSITLRGTGSNGGTFNISMVLNIPVKDAEVVIIIRDGGSVFNANLQTYFCERDGIQKPGWRFPLAPGASSITGSIIGGTHYPNGSPTMDVHVFLETFGNWAYLDEEDNTVVHPYVIFMVEDGAEGVFYWLDDEGQGQSSNAGAIDLYEGYGAPSRSFSTHPTIEAISANGGFIEGSLWVRAYPGDPNYGVLSPNTWILEDNPALGLGPDRSATGFSYTNPIVGGDNGSRIRYNIVLNTNEVVGTADIILLTATTTAVPSGGRSYTLTANSLRVNLNLTSEFEQFVRSIDRTLPTPITPINNLTFDVTGVSGGQTNITVRFTY